MGRSRSLFAEEVDSQGDAEWKYDVIFDSCSTTSQYSTLAAAAPSSFLLRRLGVEDQAAEGRDRGVFLVNFKNSFKPAESALATERALGPEEPFLHRLH